MQLSAVEAWLQTKHLLPTSNAGSVAAAEVAVWVSCFNTTGEANLIHSSVSVHVGTVTSLGTYNLFTWADLP